MPPSSKQGSRRATRHELDSLVVNIELTLSSIIQGVALSVLTESARGPLGDLRFDQWPYVLNGLLIILLFWSRSVAHTLTLIRWPLEFGVLLSSVFQSANERAPSRKSAGNGIHSW